MTSDWARELVNEHRLLQEEKRLADQKTLSDRELVKNNAPQRWNVICGLVKKLSEEINQESGSTVLAVGTSQNAIHVAAIGNPEPLGTLTFDAKNNTLAVPFHGCELRLEVGQKDQLVWRSTCTSDTWNDEQVAKRTLESAWDRYSRG